MADQTVSLKLEGDASDLQQALNESGQAMDDLSGQADSAASDIEGSVSGASSAWEDHRGTIDAAAAAMGAAGLAMEGFARSQQDATVELGRTSTVTGIQSDALRDLAADTANVTFATEDVIGTFHTLGRQGIDTEEDLQRVANVWDMVADATGENVVMLAESSVALRTLGIDAKEPEEALDALGFITQETTGSVGEFLTFVERVGPELRELGMDVDDTAALMAILEQEMGMTGRVARQEFRTAVNEANGDMGVMLEILGVTPEAFDAMRGSVDGSSDALHDNAQALEDSFTPLQRASAHLDELMLKYGGLADAAGMLSPVLMGAGGTLLAVNQVVAAKQRWAAANMTVAGSARTLVRRLGPMAAALAVTTDAVNTHRKSYEELSTELEGLTFAETADALAETEFGWHILTDAVRDSIMPWRAAADGLAEGRVLLDALTGSTEDAADATPELTAEVAELTDAERSARRHISAANDMLDGQTDAMDDAADSTIEATSALDDYLDAVQRATDPVFALVDAVDRVDEAQRRHTEAVNEFGEDSPEAAQAAIDLAGEIANLEKAAADGDLSFADFEAQLDTWIAMGSITEDQADDIRRGIEGAVDASDRFEGTRTMRFEAIGLGQIQGQLDRLPSGAVRALASGGDVRRGEVALVGEEGPELVQFPSAGTVHSAPDTARMMSTPTSGAGGRESSGPERFTLMLDDGSQLSGYVRRQVEATVRPLRVGGRAA